MTPAEIAEKPVQFAFDRDTFAFDNETFWEYQFESGAGKMSFKPRVPKPAYAHRCFVLTRAARQFFYHVRFEPAVAALTDNECRKTIRKVMRRNPRQRCAREKQIVIGGYSNLREFSAARAQLLKDECGGAWQSYVLRSHWRMVFPISREHQAQTAVSLQNALRRDVPSIVHLVKFPALTINHSMLLFGGEKSESGFVFDAYDPNISKHPLNLSFDQTANTFTLPATHYWAGGALDIIEIYRSWLM